MKEELYSQDQAMSPGERQRHYDKQVSQIVQFAYDNTPAVKDRMDKAGVKPSQINTTRDLELIPLITRDEIIALQKDNPPYGGLLAVPVESLYRILYSPGPFHIPISSPEAARKVLKIIHAAGMRRGDRVISTLPPLFAAGSMFMDALSLGGLVNIPAGAGNTELQVNMIRDLGITGYFGTPSFLMNLVRKAEELGYDFKKEFKLRNAIVAAEPLLPEVRNTLEQDYGVSLTNALGIGIAIWLGYECRQKSGFHMLEETFVEIVDPETGKQLGPGEIGAMVVTAFNNPAMPTIRYMTGDLSAFDDKPCPCGRTSVKLMGVMGRVGDSVKIRALYLTPEQVKSVAARFPALAKLQVVVSRTGYKDHMAFNLELADEMVDRDKLQSELLTAFQDSCRLRPDKINFVPPGTIPQDCKTIEDERSWQVKK
ncbi:phenylacetate--CoA ligase family protein [Chloroflexota bacterium]